MLNIIRGAEDIGLAVVEVDDNYHVVYVNRTSGQVFSALPRDRPTGGGTWFAGWSNAGVRYVSSALGRSGAMTAFRRCQRAG